MHTRDRNICVCKRNNIYIVYHTLNITFNITSIYGRIFLLKYSMITRSVKLHITRSIFLAKMINYLIAMNTFHNLNLRPSITTCFCTCTKTCCV